MTVLAVPDYDEHQQKWMLDTGEWLRT